MKKFYLMACSLFLFNIVLSMPAFAMLSMTMDDVDPNKVHIGLSSQAVAPSIFQKLLPEEQKCFQSTKTPDEQYNLGRRFAFEKFGLNLLQYERDQIAVSLFETSGTREALGRLGYLYKEDRAGINLQEAQRYTRAKELLERDSSPWAFSIIGDMYNEGKYEHSGGRMYDVQRVPSYKEAAEYYRKSKTGYSWYMLGTLYSKDKLGSGCYTHGRMAQRCFDKSRKLGYEVPKEQEYPCGGFFGVMSSDTTYCDCLSIALFGSCCLYIPCCIGYCCSNSIPEDQI